MVFKFLQQKLLGAVRNVCSLPQTAFVGAPEYSVGIILNLQSGN